MELHLVHESGKGEHAVLGVFLEEGAENSGYRVVFANLPPEPGEEAETQIPKLDPGALLPSSLRRFSYDGSLTTPPCTEGVRWTVLADPVEVSAEQLSAFTEIYSGTARPVQPLNGRPLVLGG
jgi:carbonic anhydrase